MWKHGRHPNVVPFQGVTIASFQLISDWMLNGNIIEYIEKHPGADPLILVCLILPCGAKSSLLHQLRDITEGLSYLHSCYVVHGDLKGVRVPKMSP